jgi:hypothetical protein
MVIVAIESHQGALHMQVRFLLHRGRRPYMTQMRHSKVRNFGRSNAGHGKRRARAVDADWCAIGREAAIACHFRERRGRRLLIAC